MNRMVLLAFAACGIPLVFAIQHFRRETPVDTKTALAAPAVAKPASNARDQEPAAVAAAQAKANAVAAALAGPAIPPDSGDGLPAFDIARIEPTGEAVIAGRAIPGATVELLRIARSRSSRSWRPRWRPLCQAEARPPPWSCRRSQPPPSPAAIASGASAGSDMVWARAMPSFTRRTGSRSAIRI